MFTVTVKYKKGFSQQLSKLVIISTIIKYWFNKVFYCISFSEFAYTKLLLFKEICDL